MKKNDKTFFAVLHFFVLSLSLFLPHNQHGSTVNVVNNQCRIYSIAQPGLLFFTVQTHFSCFLSLSSSLLSYVFFLLTHHPFSALDLKIRMKWARNLRARL